MPGGTRPVKLTCVGDTREESPGKGSKGRHPLPVYHVTKVQGILKEEQGETRRRMTTGKVVGFLQAERKEDTFQSPVKGDY